MKKFTPKRNSKKFNQRIANRKVRRSRKRIDTPIGLREDDFPDGNYYKKLDERWNWKDG